MRTALSRPLTRLAAVLLAAGLVGCASRPYSLAPLPPAKYQVLGQAEGKGCGSLALIAPAYYVIPVGLNDRVERAYRDALASVPGATHLINVKLVEDWNWWLVGTQRCVTITGDAIKELA